MARIGLKTAKVGAKVALTISPHSPQPAPRGLFSAWNLMADSTIFDLTAETVLTAAHEFVTQDTSAETRAQAATFALMGGLEWSAASVTTGNVTGVVGTLHGLDISGLTADRDFVLPNDANVGERVGVFITAGMTSSFFELNLKSDATASEVNGADASSTPWSQLLNTNEFVMFRCIKAGGAGDTDWVVEVDKRIPCVCLMTLSADQTSFPEDTWTAVELDTATVNVGAMGDTTGNDVTIRRAGTYFLSAGVTTSTVAANSFVRVRVRDLADTDNFLISPKTNFIALDQGGAGSSVGQSMSAADDFELQAIVDDFSGATTGSISSHVGTYLYVQEIL